MAQTKAVVIADAGPIIHLDELHCLDILSDFGRVIVPETVWLEVAHHRPRALCAQVNFIRQRAVGFSPQVNALTPLYTLRRRARSLAFVCCV